MSVKKHENEDVANFVSKLRDSGKLPNRYANALLRFTMQTNISSLNDFIYKAKTGTLYARGLGKTGAINLQQAVQDVDFPEISSHDRKTDGLFAIASAIDALTAEIHRLHSATTANRRDQAGRDVTDLPDLWDASDTVEVQL